MPPQSFLRCGAEMVPFFPFFHLCSFCLFTSFQLSSYRFRYRASSHSQAGHLLNIYGTEQDRSLFFSPFYLPHPTRVLPLLLSSFPCLQTFLLALFCSFLLFPLSLTIHSVNCPFYYKIGACRHGERCSRLHNKPTESQTLLINNLFQVRLRRLFSLLLFFLSP